MSNKNTGTSVKDFLQLVCTVVGAIIILSMPFLYLFCVSFSTAIDKPSLQSFLIGVQAIAGFLTAGAIIAAFAQVREAKKQIRDTRSWNKMSFALTFLPHQDKIHQWEQLLESQIQFISRTAPLTQADLDKINNPENSELFLVLKNYLNMLESYALAINKGLADEDTAKCKYRTKIVSHYREMTPFIASERIRHKRDAIYKELEIVYARWKDDAPQPGPRYGDDHHAGERNR